MAKIIAGVERDLAVRYGSMTTSAVPATGTLRKAGHQDDGAPARGTIFKTGARQPPCSQQKQKDAQRMPEKNHQIHGQVGQPGGVAHQVGKQGKVGMRHEELGAKRIQGGLGGFLDGGHVDGGVVGAEVIAVDQDGQGSDQHQAEHHEVGRHCAARGCYRGGQSAANAHHSPPRK